MVECPRGEEPDPMERSFIVITGAPHHHIITFSFLSSCVLLKSTIFYSSLGRISSASGGVAESWSCRHLESETMCI